MNQLLQTVLKKLELTHNKGIRLALEAFAVSKSENIPSEERITTLTEMRKLSNTKATLRVVTNKEHPIRPFCTKPVQN
jgi:hypothetical protein